MDINKKDFFNQWENEHKEWEEAYRDIDRVLEEIRRAREGEIEKWKYDTPSRILHWRNYGGLDCTISILLENNKFHLWGYAWKDKDNKIRKIWKVEKNCRTTKTREELEDIVNRLDKITENDLEEEEKLPLSTSNLVKRNILKAGVSGRAND